MSWYKVLISAKQASSNQHGILKDEFTKLFVQLDGPRDMAMLLGHSYPSKTIRLYFTPACSSHPTMKGLIDNNGALPCREPSRKTERSMSLAAGVQDRWSDYNWHQELS